MLTLISTLNLSLSPFDTPRDRYAALRKEKGRSLRLSLTLVWGLGLGLEA